MTSGTDIQIAYRQIIEIGNKDGKQKKKMKRGIVWLISSTEAREKTSEPGRVLGLVIWRHWPPGGINIKHPGHNDNGEHFEN